MKKQSVEIETINREISIVHQIFDEVIQFIPSFDITNPTILPYGLKPHTRSISWIAEQVITQQAKYNAETIGISDVDFAMPDTCLHDCVVYTTKTQRYFVNVKIHNMEGRQSKNDISAVEKLYMQYRENSDYRLIYACFGVYFEGISITFARDAVHVFSPQFLPIYINPRNDKLQAFYHHTPEYRTRKEFLNLLRNNSRSIILD